MADSKITALTAISTVDPTADPLVIVDVSDTSMAASGTTKKSTINQILGAGGTATLASATITGAATVGTTLGVTGVSTFAAGTALLPALTTTGDTNTGIYYPAADTFAVTTGGSERYRVDSSGNVGVGVTPSAGKGCLQLSSGINFPATQVASSDPNTLDDYEEGSWTPVVADASTGGNTGTCTINSAKYVKIGRQVSVQCDISGVNTTGMTAGNTFFIRGLPFVSVNGGNGNFYTYRVGRNAATVSSSAFVGDSSSSLFFPIYTANSATTDIALLVSNIVSTTSQIILSLTYFV
jgi:hypothetical protein